MVHATPDNFFDLLDTNIMSYLMGLNKFKDGMHDYIPDLITCSLEEGVTFHFSLMLPEYKQRYFNRRNFQKNSFRFLAKMVKVVEDSVCRHKVQNLVLQFTLECDGLRTQFPIDYTDATSIFYPETDKLA